MKLEGREEFVALEIPTVSKELCDRTREVLADEATSNHLGYVNPSGKMRSIIPPLMEVAINPKYIRIKNSNFKSTVVHVGRADPSDRLRVDDWFAGRGHGSLRFAWQCFLVNWLCLLNNFWF